MTPRGRTWSIEERPAALAAEPAVSMRRLSAAEAMLLIGSVSAALWFGIARLVMALL